MTKKFFGTDGIRGKTGSFPITPDFFVKIGFAAGLVLTKHHNKKTNPTVVIGKDTRISGYMFESALESGFAAAGVDVYLTGPLPTPAIAYITQMLNADIGVSITASHNPFDDNGIKLFSKSGSKLSENIEREIENLAEESLKIQPANKLGKARRLDDARDKYIQFCLSTFPKNLTLKGLKIVLDCAHGATYRTAPAVFRELGADITVINDNPDGLNINQDAGSIHPAFLQKAVLEKNADVGIAFDGDFDRCFFFDESGRFIAGEYIVGLLASVMLEKNPGASIVHDPRVVWNTKDLVRSKGGTAVQAKTGHAFVKQVMRKSDAVYGGEMSAHHYFRDFAYCDSGMIPWLVSCELMGRSGKPMSALLAERMAAYPSSGETNFTLQDPQSSIAAVRAHYEPLSLHKDETDGMSLEFDNWRFNLRASNTEPVVRLNVESSGDPDLVAIKLAEIKTLLNSA